MLLKNQGAVSAIAAVIIFFSTAIAMGTKGPSKTDQQEQEISIIDEEDVQEEEIAESDLDDSEEDDF